MNTPFVDISKFINSLSSIEQKDFWRSMELNYNFDYSMVKHREQMFQEDVFRFCANENYNPFEYFSFTENTIAITYTNYCNNYKFNKVPTFEELTEVSNNEIIEF
jgi:hypothetical protein